jgi:dephospho-CoA kinase
MIIGLTGKNGSGKGEVARILQGFGFLYFSLSDALREDLGERSIPVTRENLIREGQSLRKKFGSAVLAERTLKKIKVNASYVIDSFRHPAEVAVFRKAKDFLLWGVEADIKVRFERCAARKREGEPIVFDKFVETEEKEYNISRSEHAQDLIATLKQADVILNNSGTLEQLNEKVKKVLNKQGIEAP